MGGDWYDVIPLSGARVALVVGDVVGHGIHAAATMGRLRTAVRTLDDIVIRLSAEVVSAQTDAESVGDIGATCLYAVYDPVSSRCILARAGHVLPAVVNGNGTVDMLDLPPGPPLGLGGLPFESAEVDLPEGSLLALYTDGLIEARDHDMETGLTLLRQALAQPVPSLESACDTVFETLLPARPDDDVALLLARTHALGSRQVAGWDYDEGGRGLLLVSQVTEHWGTCHVRHGKTVWARRPRVPFLLRRPVHGCVPRRDIAGLAVPGFTCPGVRVRQTRIPGNRGRRHSL